MSMGFPLRSSRVDVPELLLAIHHGLPATPLGCTVGERVSPQEFFRLGSVWAAIPGMSEMRFVWVYCCANVRLGTANVASATAAANLPKPARTTMARLPR